MFGRRILSLRPHSPRRWWAKVRLPVVSEGQLSLRAQVCLGSRLAWSANEHGSQEQASCSAWPASPPDAQSATHGWAQRRHAVIATSLDATRSAQGWPDAQLYTAATSIRPISSAASSECVAAATIATKGYAHTERPGPWSSRLAARAAIAQS